MIRDPLQKGKFGIIYNWGVQVTLEYSNHETSHLKSFTKLLMTNIGPRIGRWANSGKARQESKEDVPHVWMGQSTSTYLWGSTRVNV